MLGVIYSCSNVPLAIWPCSFNQESLIPNLCRSFRVSVSEEPPPPTGKWFVAQCYPCPPCYIREMGRAKCFFFGSAWSGLDFGVAPPSEPAAEKKVLSWKIGQKSEKNWLKKGQKFLARPISTWQYSGACMQYVSTTK